MMKTIEYENLLKLNSPFYEGYRKKFEHVLDSGWFILGNEVKEFENAFANYNQVKYCVGVANGLDAIGLGLKLFDFPRGSEVIVPANTYIASIIPIIELGLVPVLVEPDIATYNIDPNKIVDKITSKTVAIEVVHLYGKCCSMDPINKIAYDYGLKLIEDCAQAHGAKYKNKFAGSFGNIGAFSFYPTKNLGALGDGGCILTNDENIYEKLLYLRNYGSKIKYYNKYVGTNSRLDELQASFLNFKLQYLDQINAHKRDLANQYLKNISRKYILPVIEDLKFDIYHIFNVRLDNRDELRLYLNNKGIKTEIHYPLAPHKQEAFSAYFPEVILPVTEEIHSTTLSLPISYFHTKEDIDFVIDNLNSFVN